MLVEGKSGDGSPSLLTGTPWLRVELANGSEWPYPAPSGDNRRFVSCLACRALMDEVEYDVTKARQKTTKVGSFRINPDGTQERRKVAEKKLCASV